MHDNFREFLNEHITDPSEHTLAELVISLQAVFNPLRN